MKLRSANCTDIGGRQQNEDSVREIYKGGGYLCVVADGLGGHGGGAQASALAVSEICEGWNGYADNEELERVIYRAHEGVLGIQSEECAMKSTAVVLAIEENIAAWAHVGDSRLYHFYNGNLVFQTRDHSASQIAVILGEITQEQIRFHEDRARILRALGQSGELQVESAKEDLEPGKHAFLLCSDGFWEYVLENEMEEDLAKASGPNNWLSRMLERLLERVPEDNDNNTACAVWLKVKKRKSNL